MHARTRVSAPSPRSGAARRTRRRTSRTGAGALRAAAAREPHPGRCRRSWRLSSNTVQCTVAQRQAEQIKFGAETTSGFLRLRGIHRIRPRCTHHHQKHGRCRWRPKGAARHRRGKARCLFGRTSTPLTAPCCRRPRRDTTRRSTTRRPTRGRRPPWRPPRGRRICHCVRTHERGRG